MYKIRIHLMHCTPTDNLVKRLLVQHGHTKHRARYSDNRGVNSMSRVVDIIYSSRPIREVKDRHSESQRLNSLLGAVWSEQVAPREIVVPSLSKPSIIQHGVEEPFRSYGISFILP